MEASIDDPQQYNIKENIIISGIKSSQAPLNRHLFPEKGSTGGNAPEEEMLSLDKQVIGCLSKKLDLDLVSNDISAYHTLKNRLRGKPDNIIVRFVNEKSLIKVLANVKKLRGSNMLIIEHLTKKMLKLHRKPDS